MTTNGEHKQGSNRYAVWALTLQGIRMAKTIQKKVPNIDCHIPLHMKSDEDQCLGFESFKAQVASVFNIYDGHIFIMATGIVVRIIAPLIKHKTKDPAVVVMDEKGTHVISLLSGHIGGANRLARHIAHVVHGEPVITTATDVNHLQSIDTFAKEMGLIIENPKGIKTVNMALLEKKNLIVHDPYHYLADFFPNISLWDPQTTTYPMLYISDEITKLPETSLVLRPRILVAGIGCNRGTDKKALKAFLYQVFNAHGLSIKSLYKLATIDLKKDEEGLLAMAQELELPIIFYRPDELSKIKGLKTPSKIVEQYTGVQSVCEAAALLTARATQLLVPKQVTKDITIAIARTNCI